MNKRYENYVKAACQYAVCEIELSEVAMAFIAGARWADSNRWIKPEDELPEDGQRVLTFREYTGTDSGRPRFNVELETYFDEFGFLTNKEIREKVTYWMPLNHPEQQNKNGN